MVVGRDLATARYPNRSRLGSIFVARSCPAARSAIHPDESTEGIYSPSLPRVVFRTTACAKSSVTAVTRYQPIDGARARKNGVSNRSLCVKHRSEKHLIRTEIEQTDLDDAATQFPKDSEGLSQFLFYFLGAIHHAARFPPSETRVALRSVVSKSTDIVKMAIT